MGRTFAPSAPARPSSVKGKGKGKGSNPSPAALGNGKAKSKGAGKGSKGGNDVKGQWVYVKEGQSVSKGKGKAQSQGKAQGKGLGNAGGKGTRKGRHTIVAPAANPITKGSYAKVKGTRIEARTGGVSVRVAIASGKEFHPNDVRGAEHHVAGLAGAPASRTAPQRKDTAKGKGKGKGKGKADAPATKKAGKFAQKVMQNQLKKKKKARKERPRKELTPEEEEARREKGAERHAERVLREEREVLPEANFEGTVVARGKYNAWAKLTSIKDIPSECMKKLREMNKSMRKKAAERGTEFADGEKQLVVYINFNDLVDRDSHSVIEKGQQLRFKLYTDVSGVGGCEVDVIA